MIISGHLAQIDFLLRFLEIHSQAFSTFSSILLSTSIVFSIPFWAINKLHERKQIQIDAYKELISEYTKLMEIFLCNTELNLYEDFEDLKIPNNSLQERKIKIIFSMLVALFERAYITFHNNGSWLRKKYWQEWDTYIKDWCKKPLFYRYLSTTLAHSDSDFTSYMNSIIKIK